MIKLIHSKYYYKIIKGFGFIKGKYRADAVRVTCVVVVQVAIVVHVPLVSVVVVEVIRRSRPPRQQAEPRGRIDEASKRTNKPNPK